MDDIPIPDRFGIKEVDPNPPDDGLVEAEIAAFDRFWQCQVLDMGLSCTQARDIGAPSAKMCAQRRA
jgi:hypothetical protein